MQYGRLAGNDSINAVIYRCFEFITDQRMFRGRSRGPGPGRRHWA
jgi:hypothetical protein